MASDCVLQMYEKTELSLGMSLQMYSMISLRRITVLEKWF